MPKGGMYSDKIFEQIHSLHHRVQNGSGTLSSG